MSDRRDPAVEALADALDRGLKRAQEAIERAARRNADLLETAARHTGETWMADLARGQTHEVWSRQRDGLGRALRHAFRDRKAERRRQREQEKLERKLARQRLKQEQDRLQLQASTVGEGIIGVGAALAMAGTALVNHDLWWMVFPAFGIGTWGARILSVKIADRERSRPAQPEPARRQEAAPDPRDARVDAVCTRIASELDGAAPSVKELVGKNAKAIEQLRATCRSLTARERELRALVNPEDDARLAKERDGLVARISAESDQVVRARLESALAALDEQRKQRGELRTAAARFEAEHTRIAYTLESLYTQILRLKSADSAAQDHASTALRQSLAQLGEEMDAVADAMEEVHRADLSQVSAVGDGAGRGGRERERG